MGIFLALILGAIIGAAAMWYMSTRKINGAVDDVGSIRDELIAMRNEIHTFEEREDMICRQCIEDAMQNITPSITIAPSANPDEFTQRLQRELLETRVSMDSLREKHGR
jgi:hypothetical protein